MPQMPSRKTMVPFLWYNYFAIIIYSLVARFLSLGDSFFLAIGFLVIFCIVNSALIYKKVRENRIHRTHLAFMKQKEEQRKKEVHYDVNVRYRPGRLVRIDPHSQYAHQIKWGGGLPGVIQDSSYDDYSDRLYIAVEWPNGYKNAYNDFDLNIVHPNQMKNKEFTRLLSKEERSV